MNSKTKHALDNILDTMSGGDGGVRFVYFKAFIEEFDKRAENGDKDAQSVVDVMVRFSRLIDVAKKCQ